MNEQLLNYIYDQSEKEGFAIIDSQYGESVNELVESDLIEVDPDQGEGPIRCSITEDGQKWVEAGRQQPVGTTEAPAEPPKKRGRPRKVDAEPVVEAGPPVQSVAPVAIPPWAQSSQSVTERLPVQLAAPAQPAWAVPPVPSPMQPSWAAGAAPGWTQPMASAPEPTQPVWAQPAPMPEPSQPSPFGGPFPNTPDPAIAGAVAPQPVPVGIITNLLPPTAHKRLNAKEELAKWDFDKLAVNACFHITDEQADGFNRILNAANRIHGKLDPVRFYRMWPADKIPGAPMQTGYYVFRLT